MNDHADAFSALCLRVDKRAFVGLPLPMEETLAAFVRLDAALPDDVSDEDDRFEAILFALEQEWQLSDESSLTVARALDEYLRARDED